jgi:hypothetical protein
MNLDDWRALIDHWRDQTRDIRHLDIPANIAATLGIELPKEIDMTDESTAEHEPLGAKWKKKKYFDGSTCGLKDCKRAPDGYVCDTKPTKGNPNGHLWFGPACKKCLEKLGYPVEAIIPLKELARQRGGASDLALVLDIEVGEALKRLAAAGIDEQGNTPVDQTEETPPPVVETISGPIVTPPPGEGSCGQTHSVEAGGQLALPDNGAAPSEAIVATPTIQMPTTVLVAHDTEAQGVIAFLQTFHVVDQPSMDNASLWVKEVKKKWNHLDETRKALGKPLREGLEQIQGYFKPAQDALKKAESILKAKIAEGNQRAQQAQQQALAAAQQAHATGNMQGTIAAAQQAATADVALPQGISQQMVVKFEVVDPSQLPGQYWSPDSNLIQAAINAGWRQIPGVRIWEEPQISARQ